ncbi:MAG TPA: hypothetical protein VFO85_05690 [Vicinamibacteria bacterium]|nr:hypothetical protein [Vicinamibacteria bacterium]
MHARSRHTARCARRSAALALLAAVAATALTVACGSGPGTPTPVPPAATPAPFTVTGLVATAAPPSAGCGGANFTFAGTIAVNGPGDVRYRWVRSDGAVAPDQVVRFDGAGSRVVTDSWRLSAPGTQWEQLVIVSPNAVESNRAAITVACP